MTDTDGPRWEAHSVHHETNPRSYRFMGRMDNFDIYYDKSEEPHAYPVFLNSEDDFNRFRLVEGAMLESLYDTPCIAFDQMCQLMVLLEDNGLTGPNSSHAAWDSRDKSRSVSCATPAWDDNSCNTAAINQGD